VIIVYTTDDCVWCERTKKALSEADLPFDERSIKRPVYRDEWLTYLGDRRKTVPQVVANGVLIGGYEATKEWLRAH
jgi:glutaredoxin